ncbi:MAG: type VI secretion system protein TssA [Pirellulaceae bacterium]|nr:type VI secretion system protein TssA [Pirellulaceae bacterium]
MSSIDVEKLLQELSPDQPCGENLEYDAEYLEMERATESKPEVQIGDMIQPAEEPDWKEVKRKALSLFKRTKDMRVTAHLARAVLKLDGLPDFADALKLMRGLVERYWDAVQPQLDPEDGNDPTFRVNTLASLCGTDSTLTLLRNAPLVRSRQLGIFSLHDIQRAHERAEAGGGEEGEAHQGPALSSIEAAFTDAGPEALLATLESVRQAMDDVEAAEDIVTEKVGAANATSLDPLVRMLKEIEQVLREQAERRGLGAPAAEAADEAAEGVEAEGGAVAGTVKRLSGDVVTREDAIRALDKVCEYFEKHEPSSPLPLLIRRAQRLAHKSFLDIIRDLAPDAIAQLEHLSGPVGDGGPNAGGGGGGGGGGGTSSNTSSGW